MNRRARGYIGEDIAVRFLKRRGYGIVATNAVVCGVEIDIIALDGDTVVFAEVKSSDSDTAHPAERVSARQRARYVAAAQAYRVKHSLYDADFRFDVIEVAGSRLSHIKNAFEA